MQALLSGISKKWTVFMREYRLFYFLDGGFIMEKFYKTGDVAKIFGVSQRAIQKWIKEGKIIPAKITDSGRGLFTADQIVQMQMHQVITETHKELSKLTQTQGKSQQTFWDKNANNESKIANREQKNANENAKNANENANEIRDFKNKNANEIHENANDKRNNDKFDLWISHRRELAERAKQYLPNLLYELGVTNLNKNFSCSIFNPHHADHTPSVTYYADTQTVHCHACGFHGNIFQVYAAAYNKTINKTLFDEVFAKYGLIDYTSSNIKLPTRPKITPVAPPKDAKKEIIDRSTDINAATANINLTDYWAKRGFTIDTVQYFRMGYVKGWKHPDFNNTPPSDRLILPTGDGIHSYLARDVHSDGNYKVMKVGGKVLFNLDGFNSDFIIVNEGEFDAISTYQVGFHNVVGLGGVGNKDKFVDSIAKLANKPKFIIIALDNDKSGFDAANWIHQQLDKLQIYSLIINDNFGDFKDANTLLQHDSNALKSITTMLFIKLTLNMRITNSLLMRILKKNLTAMMGILRILFFCN